MASPLQIAKATGSLYAMQNQEGKSYYESDYPNWNSQEQCQRGFQRTTGKVPNIRLRVSSFPI